MRGRTVTLTTLTLIAFASNSLLCRQALGSAAIDPAAFTAIRLGCGALALAVTSAAARARPARAGSRAGWGSGFFLFAYAIGFSFAYLSLTAGTGALILFASVQATVIAGAIHAGERLRAPEWAGVALAVGGLVYLTAPGLSAPPAVGSALMALAGVAWGLYTLRGRGSAAPLADTTRNFVCAAPMALLAMVPLASRLEVSTPGATLAAASGALASGVGYVLWYAALRGLSATRAAVVQLAVPVVAALGGVVFLSERITMRLVLSAALILGGIALAVFGRTRWRR
jgi:drug/metabolite transporter (DMT)-like permease